MPNPPEKGSSDRVNAAAFSLAGLTQYLDVCDGDPSVTVGIIDGPVDLNHPAFAGSSLRSVGPDQLVSCRDTSSSSCSHGTAIAGILAAARGSSAPAICPSCTFLLYPIFADAESGASSSEPVSPSELARAIVRTIDAGAKIINLSLAVIAADTSIERELEDACGYAAQRGVILVAAAGNQGRLGFLPLLNHNWIIPVVACDDDGLMSPESNLSPAIGRRGLRASGRVLTAAPGGSYAAMSGTSIAAAIVTGGLAVLWSMFPWLSGLGLRTAALKSKGLERRSMVPPLFSMDAIQKTIKETPMLSRNRDAKKETRMSALRDRGENIHESVAAAAALQSVARDPLIRLRPRHGQVLSQTGSCPTCAAGAEGQDSGPPTYVFAIGQIRMRFPSPATEKEFAQNMANGSTAGLTDAAALHTTIRENRYLANEVCWVFMIDSIEAYLLVPRDHFVLDQLVEALKPAEGRLDTDVIIGARGPMAPPEMCNGLAAPIVLVDRIYSFQKPELMAALSKPADSDVAEDTFRGASDELYERLQQIADNVGATNEHRALNYLAVRYPQIYTQTAEMYARNFALERVEVLPSRLAGTRNLVNVIFTYKNRGTDVEEKYRVRVDVTEKYPFLEKRLSQYFDRE